MKCVNCSKLFTITQYRGKVGKPLCPYCLTLNNFIKKQVVKSVKKIGYKLIKFKLLNNEKY